MALKGSGNITRPPLLLFLDTAELSLVSYFLFISKPPTDAWAVTLARQDKFVTVWAIMVRQGGDVVEPLGVMSPQRKNSARALPPLGGEQCDSGAEPMLKIPRPRRFFETLPKGLAAT